MANTGRQILATGAKTRGLGRGINTQRRTRTPRVFRPQPVLPVWAGAGNGDPTWDPVVSLRWRRSPPDQGPGAHKRPALVVLVCPGVVFNLVTY